MGSNGQTEPRQLGEERIRSFVSDQSYSVTAVGVGGVCRAGSDRAKDYTALFKDVSRLSSVDIVCLSGCLGWLRTLASGV